MNDDFISMKILIVSEAAPERELLRRASAEAPIPVDVSELDAPGDPGRGQRDGAGPARGDALGVVAGLVAGLEIERARSLAQVDLEEEGDVTFVGLGVGADDVIRTRPIRAGRSAARRRPRA